MTVSVLPSPQSSAQRLIASVPGSSEAQNETDSVAPACPAFSDVWPRLRCSDGGAFTTASVSAIWYDSPSSAAQTSAS